MADFKPVDRNFRLWLTTFCDKEHEFRLLDRSDFYKSAWRYDEKLDALVNEYGCSFSLSYGSGESYRPAFAYRVSKSRLEFLPIDEETGKIDDGDPIWTLCPVKWQRVDFDMERADLFLKI